MCVSVYGERERDTHNVTDWLQSTCESTKQGHTHIIFIRKLQKTFSTRGREGEGEPRSCKNVNKNKNLYINGSVCMDVCPCPCVWVWAHRHFRFCRKLYTQLTMCTLCTQNHGFHPSHSLRQMDLFILFTAATYYFILLYNIFFRQLEIKEKVQPTKWFLSWRNNCIQTDTNGKFPKEILNRCNVTGTLSLKRCWSSSDFRPQSDLILTERFERCCWLRCCILALKHTHTHTYIIHVLAKKKCQHVRKAANWRCGYACFIWFHFNSTLLYFI